MRVPHEQATLQRVDDPAIQLPVTLWNVWNVGHEHLTAYKLGAWSAAAPAMSGRHQLILLPDSKIAEGLEDQDNKVLVLLTHLRYETSNNLFWLELAVTHDS